MAPSVRVSHRAGAFYVNPSINNSETK